MYSENNAETAIPWRQGCIVLCIYFMAHRKTNA